MAEFTVAFGFFLVLALEQIVQDWKEKCTQYNMLQDETVRSHMNQSCDPEGQQHLDHGVEASSSPADVPVYREPQLHPTLRSLALLFALSLHSLFEGLAVGLQEEVSSVLQIFVAVVLHKVAVAFSLGLNLVHTELSVRAVIMYSFLFSMTSPLGMCIALALEEYGHGLNSSILNGILQALACGTFLYVTFFEVLPHELGQSENRLLKLLALLFGFSVVCCILFLDPTESQYCTCP